MHVSPLLRFVQLLPNVPIDGTFSLRDLPGSGKRIDILCRDLAACFDWGPSIWPLQHLQVLAILGEVLTLRFSCPQALPVGETEWARVISNAIRGIPPEYVRVEKKDTRQVIEDLIKTDNVIVLDEQGTDITEAQIRQHTQNSFIIGDHRGFDVSTERILKEYELPRISLGTMSYLSSHCIGTIISYFERMIVDGRDSI